MKKTSKILSIILAILLVISTIPLTASAETPTSGTCGENLTWSFDVATGTLTISGTGDMYDYEVDFGGFVLSPFADFEDEVKHIVISDGVTDIGDNAFSSFSNLENVTFGSDVTKIGTCAFYYCTSLTSVSFPDGLTEILSRSFYNCTSLTSVSFPDSLTRIANNTFKNCTSLTDVSFPDSLMSIGEYAFAGCDGLTSIIIPISVQSINRCAFYNCSNLTEVYYEGTYSQLQEIIPSLNVLPLFSSAIVHYGSTDPEKHLYHAVVTAPTCTERGYTKYTCELCGVGYIPGYVKALGHDMIVDEAIAPDCENTGLTEGSHCSRCDDATVEQETVPALGHTYESVVTAPTCTERGYTTFTCECGDSYVSDYVNATGHNHTSEITTPATHTTTGIMTYTCTCGDTYTETINKLANHKYDAVITVPTCTDNGYTTFTCECGNTYVDDYVDALGHADNDNDGYCDADNELLDPSIECDHSCHKDGISGFFWRIINVFNRLFGLNKTCPCGLAHY